MEKVTIKTAKFGATNYNGLAVDYIIQYQKTESGFLKDTEKELWLKITISHFVLIGWQLPDNMTTDQLIKLTFPFAVRFITERLKDGTLKEFEEIIISREDNFFPYPYDINKIKKIDDYEIYGSENNIDIGKRIQTNQLADSIIELRDNINALIYHKHKDILLKLGQERNILNFFRTIDNQEQFSYAISTLGNLVNDLNVSLLKKITNHKEKDAKSFELLEIMLSTIDSNPNETIEIFKTINRIRQGFPIHTDKTEIIKNLNTFKIEYPITNHDEAWKIILEKYKIGLEKLLMKIKKYAA